MPGCTRPGPPPMLSTGRRASLRSKVKSTVSASRACLCVIAEVDPHGYLMVTAGAALAREPPLLPHVHRQNPKAA